jgi:hypothetical protein
MFHQAAILSDVIRNEHTRAVSPALLERRQMADALEALRCCTGASLTARLRIALDRSTAICCATA